MQAKSILMSQAIRFYANAEPIAERRSPVPLIRGLQDMYGFVQVPLTISDLDFTKGVTFLRGYYKGNIIDKLQIYENGLLCEAATDNSVAMNLWVRSLTGQRQNTASPSEKRV
jgi:hypothetical protein